MDGFISYKMSRKPKQNLMPAPPYCRKYERQEAEKEKSKGNSLKLQVSDPASILLLCESLVEHSTQTLEAKINAYLQREADAKTVFLISILPLIEEAVVQVVGNKCIEPEIRLPLTGELMKKAFKRRRSVICGLEEMDANLRTIIEQVVGGESCEVITVPVFSRSGSGTHTPILLLACLVNALRDEQFVTHLVQETFRFCLAMLVNTSKSEEEARLKVQCQSLLTVARKLFSHLGDLSDLLKEIMSEARRLTNSERCSLFLMDPDHLHLVAKVFDGMNTEGTEVRISRDQGIAGHVAVTGTLLNIKDAYQHPLFYKGMDEATGFHTRNILCFPIRDENGIIGVAQLCNKADGPYDYIDEEVALAFSIYCGLSITHTLLYKKIQDAQAKSKLSNELMMYHMQISTSDVVSLVLCPNAHDEPAFCDFKFSSRHLPFDETTCYVLKMYEDLKLTQKFQIKRDMLARFILYAKRGYRDTPYHNWSHAVAVAHFAYQCVKNLQLMERGYLTDVEVLAYLTSSLCHDIDHRGTTNSFQLQSGSVLASLYSSEGSVMERHHLSQTICIINTENCNFLECLDNAKYEKCLDLIKDNILATDLAQHFKVLKQQNEMAKTGYDVNNPIHRHLLLCLLMTAADLSDQIKEWPNVKRVAKMVYDEFFSQGDMEKSMGNKPLEMMDRDKASIPDLQIDFLTHVCVPVFDTFMNLFPESECMAKAIRRNIRCWETSKQVFQQHAKGGYSSMDILASSQLEYSKEMIEAFEEL